MLKRAVVKRPAALAQIAKNNMASALYRCPNSFDLADMTSGAVVQTYFLLKITAA